MKNNQCKNSLSGKHYWIGGYWIKGYHYNLGFPGGDGYKEALYEEKSCKFCGVVDDKDYKNRDQNNKS